VREFWGVVAAAAAVAALGFLVRPTSVTGATALWTLAGAIVVSDFGWYFVLPRLRQGSAKVGEPAGPLGMVIVEPVTEANDVFLRVTNTGQAGRFAAKVMGVTGFSGGLATPWSIPWRGIPDEWRRLGEGEAHLLHIAATDGFGPARRMAQAFLWIFKMNDGRDLPARLNLHGITEPINWWDVSGRVTIVVYRENARPVPVSLRVGFENRANATGNLAPRAEIMVVS